MKLSQELCQKIALLSEDERSGLGLCAAMSSLIDHELRKAWAAGESEAALYAVGGYGRAEMAPFSDIDILFLTRGKPSARAAEHARAVVYALWDGGFEVGYSVRSFRDCLDVGLSDTDARTAMLESRFLSGNPDVDRAFREDVMPKLLRSGARTFVQKKLKEHEKRRRSYGATAFLLEPHVKEGEGGLRDVHTAFWLSRVAFGVEGFLGIDQLLDRRQVIKLYAAYDYLERIRVRLHLETRRKHDTLDFENQPRLARAFGFQPRYGLSPEERLMRRYYLHAREISDISGELIEQAVWKIFGKIGGPSWFRTERVSPPFKIIKGYLVAEKPESLSKTPHLMMDAFHHRVRVKAPMSRGLKAVLRGNMRLVSGSMRSDPQTAEAFLRILRDQRAYPVLREMNDMGFLGKYLPEFGRLRALVVREPYHAYTVDEHTLHALRNLDRLNDRTHPGPADLKTLYAECTRKELLHLAILLHDAGKAGTGAYGHHHVDLWSVLDRLGLPTADRPLVEFLVKSHLLMSQTAQKRDMDDPRTIMEFTTDVDNEQNLKYLYLMTYADISAVRPGYWSEWRGYLVRTLFNRSLRYFRGEWSGERKGALLDHVRGCPDVTPEELERHLDGFPPRYLRSADDAGIVEDLRLLRKAGPEGIAVRFQKLTDLDCMEVTIGATDRPGLLGSLAAVFATNALNILRALIFTGREGRVIDRFLVSDWSKADWPGLTEKLAQDLDTVYRSGWCPSSGGRPRRRSPLPPHITLDNESTERTTLIGLLCSDRPGLLADVMGVLYETGLNVESARIETDGHTASDSIEVSRVPASELWTALDRLWSVVSS